MKDSLGNRMKERYEDRTRIFLPRRSYIIIRLDGKAFHSYVDYMKCKKPYDLNLMIAMDLTMRELCRNSNIQGIKLGYTQSDEISLLLTDFDNIDTQSWFDNNIQKMVSISASMATAYFNKYMYKEYDIIEDINNNKLAFFDSRVFIIPDPIEVMNYFRWRYKDCERNSIQMLAQSLYSHEQLQNKKCNDLQEMIYKKGKNWSKLDNRIKNGCWTYYDFDFKDDMNKTWIETSDKDILVENKDKFLEVIGKHGYEEKVGVNKNGI
jgi:tRNA(His) 5'-end guanylyltransferase